MPITNELLTTVLRQAGRELSRKEFLTMAGHSLAVGVAASKLASCQTDGNHITLDAKNQFAAEINYFSE